MANVAIATPDLSDAATLISEGTVAASLPISNLQNSRPSKVARWTSLTGIRLKIDLLDNYTIALIVLLFTNLSSAGQVRIVIADTEADLDGSNPNQDTGWYTPTDGAIRLITSAAGRWISIEIDDPTNTDGYFDAGRLYVAAEDVTWWQPEVNAGAGWQLALEDDSQVATALDGGQLATQRNQRRVISLQFECQSEAELYGEAFPIMQARGLHSDLLLIKDPEATAYLALHTVYGLMTQLAPVVHREADLYGWSLTVREMV